MQPFVDKLIQLPSGILLEADLAVPLRREQNDGTKVAVCLHPWSWLGGSKDDPTLLHLLGPLRDRGFYVLRYNSRGVGKSTGWASFTGSSEAQDLRDLVQWFLQTVAEVRSVLVVGYSYGALIASLHPILPAPIKTSHLLLSYPLGPRGWLTAFKTKTYASALTDLVRDPAANVLVVYGDRDEFTGMAKYDGWADGLRRDNEGEGRARLRIEKIGRATHFWFDRGSALDNVIRDWAS